MQSLANTRKLAPGVAKSTAAATPAPPHTKLYADEINDVAQSLADVQRLRPVDAELQPSVDMMVRLKLEQATANLEAVSAAFLQALYQNQRRKRTRRDSTDLAHKRIKTKPTDSLSP